jgi:CYTH domain-containing protein
MELERKFLLGGVPEDIRFIGSSQEITRNYLLIVPREEIHIKRVQDVSGSRFFISVKAGSGLMRKETEIEISQEAYLQLFMLCGKPLEKKRSFVEFEGYKVFIDQYDYPPEELGLSTKSDKLLIAKVEFSSNDEVLCFKPPTSFGKEITFESSYKDKNLWRALQKN